MHHFCRVRRGFSCRSCAGSGYVVRRVPRPTSIHTTIVRASGNNCIPKCDTYLSEKETIIPGYSRFNWGMFVGRFVEEYPVITPKGAGASVSKTPHTQKSHLKIHYVEFPIESPFPFIRPAIAPCPHPLHREFSLTPQPILITIIPSFEVGLDFTVQFNPRF
jgi:hypothetical protein